LPSSGCCLITYFPALQISISQQIIVDAITLAFIIYDLDRKGSPGVTSAHLVSIQKHRHENGLTPSLSPPTPPPVPISSAYSHDSHTTFIPHLVRRPEPSSLSCALIPNLTSPNTSLLF